MNFLQWTCEMLDQAGFKGTFGGCIGLLGWLLGGFDAPFLALVILFLGDYLLGLGRAIKHKRVSIERMRSGIIKFVLYVIAVAMAEQLEIASHGAIPWFDIPIRDFMIGYLAICEFLSVSVHLAAEGVRMPEWLVSRIQRVRDIAEKGECEGVPHD